MRRPSPSLIVSSLALVVATGGTSYAAVKIGSADIKDGTIRSVDVKNDNLKSQDIKNGSLKAKDIRQGHISKEATRWALVNEAGQIEAQSGGFTVASAYAAPAPGNVYIDANEDLSDNAVVATIAIQNQTATPNFAGEISATRCAIPGVVACAPTGTNTNEFLAVSPRNSDGSVTTDANRKRFYVVVVGDSRDRVAP